MGNLEFYGNELKQISEDIKGWYPNRYNDSDQFRHFYQRELARGSERLVTLVHDLGAVAHLQLEVGDRDVSGYKFYSQPYDMVAKSPQTIASGSILNLDFIEHYYAKRGDFLRSIPYFGDGSIYISCRGLSKALHQGSKLSIEVNDYMQRSIESIN